MRATVSASAEVADRIVGGIYSFRVWFHPYGFRDKTVVERNIRNRQMRSDRLSRLIGIDDTGVGKNPG